MTLLASSTPSFSDPTVMLNVDHFLSLPRPDVFNGPPSGVPDTTTLAAHDFDVDNRTGFMPPHPPVARLPSDWEAWEEALDSAILEKLQLGDNPHLSESEVCKSEQWRERVRRMPLTSTSELKKSELLLRRAHLVLAWVMHFYVHSLPPDAPVIIPPPIAVPLLQVCAQLQLPPVLTYSDDVLYNWAPRHLPSDSSLDDTPRIDNLRCQTLFTGTKDEEEFYLTSTRMELRGVEALELMRSTMDEAFVGDDIAIRRITQYLLQMSKVIADLRTMLLSVREHCKPDVFYHSIRPWFRGADSDPLNRKWVFEGIEQDPSLQEPTELSGPSAGQSSLIHSLDIFLGVDKYSHSISPMTDLSQPTSSDLKNAFLKRMQQYMPRHHRNFLNHLSNNPRPLRQLVINAADPELFEAYNAAVQSLKEFRDSHMTVVAIYIIGPARRNTLGADEGDKETAPLKGTGGSDLAKFLKKVRDQTTGALLPSV